MSLDGVGRSRQVERVCYGPVISADDRQGAGDCECLRNLWAAAEEYAVGTFDDEVLYTVITFDLR